MYFHNEQPIKTGATSLFPYSAELEAAFRFKPKFGDPVSLAIKVGNTLHIPRRLAPIGKEDHRVRKSPVAIDCKMPPIDQEQADLIEQSVHLLKTGHNHIFEAPTGFGKSYCGAAIACKLGQPTLIIVTKQDLMDSWHDCLTQLVGLKNSDIGIIQQDKCEYVGKKFVIAMIHSLVKEEKYDAHMRNYFGTVLFDECHHLGADLFVRACMMFPALYRLGLSATTQRSDGKWCMIEAHIGPVMVIGKTIPMSPRVLVKKTGWKIPLVQRWVDDPINGGKTKTWVPIPYGPGRMVNVIKAMAADHTRNMIIVEFVKSAHKAGRNTVIMSELVDDHLKILFKLLALNGVPGEDMDYYIGGRKKADLEIAKKKRIVLATYQMCGEGTNVPRWDTLVMASPRANIKQGIGRIMRRLEGKKEPVALDLVDWDSILNGFYLAREKTYYSIKANIVRM
jgi:superfamily II DNA or RNA helicase